ncbi:hypothetical protein [Sphingobacterium sp. UDSM-2020]|uniref:hypothetical protein n=1 Tax=Sphingobacterium sp. UDSM-2020 TaxID=2795738 RepID=UPI001935E576|nr:hypothetical protein [Sphingobacterium sp. UDSM-2020]QQD15531.1 hypothetical protein JAZ75_08465 [Sphingobacterium sp. UDSM-2020]
MNKNNRKMYVAPTIEELVIELEQGIAAGSGNAGPTPSVDDFIEGGGSAGNGEGD